MHSNDKKEKWIMLLSAMRSNYITTIGALSGAQSDLEKRYNSKKSEYKEDTVKAIKEWIKSTERIREDFRKIFEEGFKSSFSFIPKAFDNPLMSDLEKVVKRARKNFYDILGNFTFSWIYKKDE